MSIFSRISVGLIFGLLFNNVIAGMPSGPYFVWADLVGGKESRTSKEIRLYVEGLGGSASTFCGHTARAWVVFFQERPDGITDELLKKALLDGSVIAKNKLIHLMLSYRDEKADINEGIDGVVVYTPFNGGQFVSMDIKGKILKSPYMTINPKNNLIKSFCKVSLEVYRR